ncbi:MAG: Uma2 family endonuclease [Symploca sp. SIO2B6]|nr:Uma2 family endonuclease [Symploca sp. SIO2B6]
MTQAIPQLVTFTEFVESKSDGGRYELHDGVIVSMAQPLGGDEEITGFLTLEIAAEIKRLNFPWSIPKQALVKPPDGESAYSPDVLVLNCSNLANEPLWKQESTVTLGESIPLVIEVVSTNWRSDYYTKRGAYEGMEIIEYWIVDYLALGSKSFVTESEIPTVSVYQLVDDEYKVTQLRGSDRIQSSIFPELHLTANQIFQAATP